MILVNRVDYLYRVAVNLNLDSTLVDVIGSAFIALTKIDETKTIQYRGGYKTNVVRTGRRGRPKFDINIEHLSFLLKQGFKVEEISGIIGVGLRTIEFIKVLIQIKTLDDGVQLKFVVSPRG